jgi:hypothetical protein
MKLCHPAILLAAILIAKPAVGAEPPKPEHARITSHIRREPVTSTALARVGYSKDRHILEVELLNGAIYRYLGVPPSVYRALKEAPSKGRFYDHNVRYKYPSRRVRRAMFDRGTNWKRDW